MCKPRIEPVNETLAVNQFNTDTDRKVRASETVSGADGCKEILTDLCLIHLDHQYSKKTYFISLHATLKIP